MQKPFINNKTYALIFLLLFGMAFAQMLYYFFIEGQWAIEAIFDTLSFISIFTYFKLKKQDTPEMKWLKWIVLTWLIALIISSLYDYVPHKFIDIWNIVEIGVVSLIFVVLQSDKINRFSR